MAHITVRSLCTYWYWFSRCLCSDDRVSKHLQRSLQDVLTSEELLMCGRGTEETPTERKMCTSPPSGKEFVVRVSGHTHPCVSGHTPMCLGDTHPCVSGHTPLCLGTHTPVSRDTHPCVSGHTPLCLWTHTPVSRDTHRCVPSLQTLCNYVTDHQQAGWPFW